MGYTLHTQNPPLFENNARMIMQQSDKVYASGKKITDAFKPHEWEGKRCFLIGGGESLKGFNFHRLDTDLSIGINRSFEFYNSTILYMMDIVFHDMIFRGEMSRFTNENVTDLWAKFTGVKTMICPVSPYPLNADIHAIKRIEIKKITLDISEGIYAGSNSGFGALMLAIAMGASPIYLLGYDMKISKTTHWHSGYPSQTYADQNRKTESFKVMFEEFAPGIQGLGFKVVNLNPDSDLKCFEFGNVEEVLKEKVTC